MAISSSGSHACNTPDNTESEQHRAIDVLLERLEERSINVHHAIPLAGEERERIILSGGVTFFGYLATVSDLPGDKGWYWSQTKAKKELYLSGSSTKLKFWKVITRYRYGERTACLPNFKVWFFQMSSPLTPPSTMVWCEKGRVHDEPTNRQAQVVSLTRFRDLFPSDSFPNPP